MLLPQTLAEPGRYEVRSTAPLCAAVRKAVLERTRFDADIRPIPELQNLRVRDDVRPLALLLALGKTSSALPGLRVHGAAGLAGLTALRTASRWAIAKYLWAFAEHRPDLRLSSLTDQVRFHQRSVLSEHLGIALATDLVERFILDRPASVVDADAVSYDPILEATMDGVGSHRPDYFWYCQDGDNLSQVVVVEVKGTSVGHRSAVRQLARGVEQVLIPSPIAGVRMRRIVVGAVIKNKRITAYAVEVVSVGTATPQLIASIRRDDEASATPADAIRVDDFDDDFDILPDGPTVYEAVSWGISANPVEPALAVEQARREDQARLYSFVGQQTSRDVDPGASDWLQQHIDSLETVVTEDGVFKCERLRIVLDHRVLYVRTGVAEELLPRPADLPQPELADRRDSYRRNRSNSYKWVLGESQFARTGIQAITSPDGCLLSVSLDEDRSRSSP